MDALGYARYDARTGPAPSSDGHSRCVPLSCVCATILRSGRRAPRGSAPTTPTPAPQWGVPFPFLRMHRSKAVDGNWRSRGSTGFEALNPLQKGEELLSHARRGLWPIFSRDTASIRHGDRISISRSLTLRSPLASCSLSLPQNGWHGSKKVRGVGPISWYPVDTVVCSGGTYG